MVLLLINTLNKHSKISKMGNIASICLPLLGYPISSSAIPLGSPPVVLVRSGYPNTSEYNFVVDVSDNSDWDPSDLRLTDSTP